MTSELVIGLNTYVDLDTADTYLGDSIRAASWALLDTDVRKQALISAFRLFEKQQWSGLPTGMQEISSVLVADGGTGYVVDDLIFTSGDSPAVLKVLAVTLGVVDTLAVIDQGLFATQLTDPLATTGGTGTGLTVDATWVTQTASFPRTGMKCEGVDVDSLTVPLGVEEAQMEEAFELSVKPALETASGTGSNTKALHAGSASIEYFRPTDTPGRNQRFPTVVMELLRCFLGGSAGASVIATGTCAKSQFDRNDRYGFQQPLP